MKEVQAGRYAGPFEELPFEYFIQSPIGLVPKDQGTKTRFIFHLSHPRDGKGGKSKNSVNGCIPEHLCSVEYPDFQDAIRICLREGKDCKMGKTDFSMAFRNVPL